MSLSPQSLARTRDKRSLRVPARFDDFSEIPPEFTYRNVAEALRMKSRRSQQTTEDFEQESIPKLRPTRETTTNSRRSAATSSRRSRRDRRRERSSRSASARALLTIAKTEELGDEHDEHMLGILHGEGVANVVGVVAGHVDDVDVSELLCDELTPSEGDLKELDGNTTVSEERRSRPRLKSRQERLSTNRRSIVSSKDSLSPPSAGKSTQNITCESITTNSLYVEKLDTSIQSQNKRGGHTDDKDEVVKIWKGNFHPSIMIRKNNVKFNETAIKPLVEHKPNSPATPVPLSPENISKTSHSSPRKRTKGFSLMVRPGNSPSQQSGVVQPQRSQQPMVQQQKFFNNLPSNMQYGTRLMLNEPVYLPKGVGNIAPITTTLQQIINCAKKLPFTSRKSEACIAYQEERKLNHIVSAHSAMVRIAHYLGVRDRMNLRCVNRHWMSIVDCQQTWQRLLITSAENSLNWKPLSESILKRYRVSEIAFNEYVPSDSVDLKRLDLFKLINSIPSLKKISVRSVNSVQNTVAHRLLQLVTFFSPVNYTVDWTVKVCVDDAGLALVDLDGDDNEGKTKSVELYDLEDKLDDVIVINPI